VRGYRNGPQYRAGQFPLYLLPASWHFCVLFRGIDFPCSAAISSPKGRCRFKFAFTPRHATGLRIEENRGRLADQIDSLIRETIPSDELQTVLDNLGVPYQRLKILAYSNSGTFWPPPDGEILVQIEKKCAASRRALTLPRYARKFPAAVFPRRPVFLSNPRTIVTQNLEFRARPAAHRTWLLRATISRLISPSHKNWPTRCATFPGRRRRPTFSRLSTAPRCTWISTALAFQTVGLQARDVAQKPAGIAQLQLPDRTCFLARSQEWRELQTLPCRLPQYPHGPLFKSLQNTPVSGSVPGTRPQILAKLWCGLALPARTCHRLALQLAADDQRVCSSRGPGTSAAYPMRWPSV